MGIRKLVAMLALLLAMPALPSAAQDEPGVRHRLLMKGSVTAVADDGIYLCIGSRDGAAAGQVLDVFRVRKRPGTGGKQRTGLRFVREHVGRLEIVEIVDQHFARAKAVEGDAREGDLVELERPEPVGRP